MPFFCYIATNAPHAPYNVENRYADMYRDKVMETRARFYGMITNIDDNFARLRKRLAELELEKDTILIFMTDNGSSEALSLDENGTVIEGYNAGLRGMKNSEYDGGHRTPFFIKWENGGIQGGKDIGNLCANVDFMPTILDLCGIKTEKTFHGISLKDGLIGKRDWEDERIVVTDSQRVPHPIKWRKSCAMAKEWRLVNGKELYNLETDRHQDHDIAAQHPEMVKKLRDGYEKWWETVKVNFENTIPIYIDRENYLTAHDWRGDETNCVWHQGLVRQGQQTAGYWEVKVTEDGVYNIKLYRWSEETGYAICQGIIGNDSGFDKKKVHEKWHSWYENGVSIAIDTAVLKIGCQSMIQKVKKEDVYAEFELELSAGEYKLEGVFQGKNVELGAYYAKIVRK